MRKNSSPSIKDIVFFDTCSAIDALQSSSKKVALSDVRNRMKDACRFYKDCSQKGIYIGLSVIAIAELLVDITPKNRATVFNILKNEFIFLGYTEDVAQKTAELYDVLGLKTSKDKSRSNIKDDLKILASLLCFGGKKLYTVDAQLRKYATRFNIEVFPKNFSR